MLVHLQDPVPMVLELERVERVAHPLPHGLNDFAPKGLGFCIHYETTFLTSGSSVTVLSRDCMSM